MDDRRICEFFFDIKKLIIGTISTPVGKGPWKGTVGLTREYRMEEVKTTMLRPA